MPLTSIMSDDGNQLMYNQMMHNILETINSVCTQFQIVILSTKINFNRVKKKLLKKYSLSGVQITLSESS